MRVLYLAHRVPDAPTKGDKIRSYHQVRALASRHEVHVFALDDEPGGRPPPAWRDEVASIQVFPLRPLAASARAAVELLRGGSLSAAHFAEPALRIALREAERRHAFDVRVVFSGAMHPLLGSCRRSVLDLVDVDSAKFQAYHEQGAVSGPRRWASRVEARRLARLEARACESAEVTLLTTEAEAELLRRFARPRRLEVLGNGVDLDAYPYAGVEQRAAREILFVGALDYPANVDAVRRLVRELLPGIRGRVPEAAVTLVGSRPGSEVRELAREPGVTLAANVPSVVPYLHRATVSVLPFRVARGIQNKALEALAAGLPLVLSEACAKGLKGRAGVHYLTGEDAEALVAATTALLLDRSRRESLAREGRQLVESSYSWRAVLRRLDELVEEVGGGA